MKWIIGVDCATDPKNVGMARAQQGANGWTVTEVVACSRVQSPVDVLTNWLREDTQALVALDAPLGWPEALPRALREHRAGEAVDASREVLFNRATDRFVYGVYAKKPLNVGADRIARTALAALELLQKVRQATGLPLPLAWKPETDVNPSVIEVYPAATLASRGLKLPYKNQKKPAERLQACGQISSLFERHLVLPYGFRVESVTEHEVDAVLCVIAGLDFLRGEAAPPEDRALAEREGWIWVKRTVGENQHAR